MSIFSAASRDVAGPVRLSALPAPSRACLEANLAVIAERRPDLARRLAETAPDPALEFTLAPDGALTAVRDGRALASKRRPLDEAGRVAGALDVREHAVFVTLGFGLGHHVRAIASKLGKTGLLCVFEPDLPLLRAVLEREDHSAWMRRTNVVFFADPDDTAAISSTAKGIEAIFGLGVRFVEHGPSAVRLGDAAGTFSKSFTRAVAALRTSIVTTMVQTEITIRNALMNAEHYAARAGSGDEGVCDLKDLAAGRPAIVVSAGPSLRRNIHLLKDPAVRERCVIIAVQTTLKTLLSEGIRPHFVCALDYHEISKRFYEGLTAEDVSGITLIAEPKVSPAVLDAYPGSIRTPADETLDALLPADLAGEHGTLRAGSTVAHLANHVARHLGCDPVILVGQDLAFTGGLYYGEGAAIHEVWAPELGPFRTLETLEWERIARSRKSLRTVPDRFGGTLFTDEQMATYLAQFERDFADAADHGLTTINATEGGAAIAHTTTSSLAEALRTAGDAPPLPDIPVPPRTPLEPHRRDALRARLRDIRQQTGRLGALCEAAAAALRKMQHAGSDQKRLNKLIDEAHTARREAAELRPAYDLVQRINQTGAFNRARADRDINLAGLDPVERQRRQIQRDIVNVAWLGDAAAEVARLLDAADGALAGGPKLLSTSDAPTRDRRAHHADVAALVAYDPEFDSRARAREPHLEPLRALLARLDDSRAVTSVVILSPDPGALANTIESTTTLRVNHAPLDVAALRKHREAVASARDWAPEAWRGGLGGATVYDELIDPTNLHQAVSSATLDAALLLADDWTRCDADLLRAVVERWRDDPEQRRVVFTQAGPGLAGIVVSAEAARDFASADEAARPWSTFGGMLGYMPFNPLADPIAKPLCVPVNHSLRDATPRTTTTAPAHIVLELTRNRLHGFGESADWSDDTALTEHSAAEWIDVLRRLTAEFPAAALSVAGAGDPLTRDDAIGVLEALRTMARRLHVRTNPLHPIDRLRAAAAVTDVLSLDLLANSPDTFERLTGEDRFHEAVENIETLLAERRVTGPYKLPWIVPRITRCETASGDIANFHDRWLMHAGASVIDPLPRSLPSERFTPLTLPRHAQRQAAASVLTLRADGAAMLDPAPHPTGVAVTNVFTTDPRSIWAAILEARGLA